jgi:hypothetical protein
MGNNKVADPVPGTLHQATLTERARCIRVANHDAHLASVGAMKFSFSGREGTGKELTLLEAAQRMAELIVDQIENGDDPGICNCENERLS